MIPSRFAIDYPRRCLELLEAFEPTAHKHDLVGTFSVMLASSILLVPWERAGNKHPLLQERGGGFQAALNALKKRKWLEAEFWGDRSPGEWRFSRIMGDPNDVAGWRDEEGRLSFSREASTMDTRRVKDVFPVMRNALAHGNIVYLDALGQETVGARVDHLAFLSRYEESTEEREAAETYRLVTVREADFLPFVRAWARWVADHHDEESSLKVA